MSLLCAALSLAGCDSQLTQEEFESTLPPLQISVEPVGPSPARDTLRIRVTGLNTEHTLVASGMRLDGERVSVRETRIDARTVELATYVSELDGTHTVAVDARDLVRTVVGRDTLVAPREATGEARPTIARTYWQRLVTRTSAYESNVSDVFADARGDLWVRLSAYRSSFWSSPDGLSFTRRRSGFERFIASEGDTAWIEYHTAGSGGQVFLAEVDLATGQAVGDYQVIYNYSLATGASGGGRFHGVYQDRRALMEIRDGIVTFVEGGPYDDEGIGASVLDYHVGPDGVHWLATARGVLRNEGAGWGETAGPWTTAHGIVDGPEGAVWALFQEGARCAVAEWTGGAWAERAAFDRDGNGSCGVVAVGATGGVWRGTTDGWITRSKDGAVDRRYASDAATSILVRGRTVWVGTGYGLREIDDHESGAS